MVKFAKSAFAAALLAAIPSASAFVAPKTPFLNERIATSGKVDSSTSLNIFAEDVTYGEESRKYRRTVYDFDAWKKHRSQDRFWRNLGNIPNSGIYRGLINEVAAVATISTMACVWNGLTGGYTDFSGVNHDAVITSLPMLTLPLGVFTVCNSSLSLLLVFRTKNCYERWDGARKMWGLMINRSRDVVRMGAQWYDPTTEEKGYVEEGKVFEIDMEERAEKLNRLSKSVWSFSRALARHLTPPDEDEEQFQKDVRERLDPEQAEALIASDHRPNRAMYDIGCAINDLPMHFMRRNQMDLDVAHFEDISGGCERIFGTPIPLVYSRHTVRALTTFLLFLPFGMWGQFGDSWNHIGLIPSASLIAMFMFGIEELANGLEEPFSILPLIGISNKIGVNCDELASFTPFFESTPATFDSSPVPVMATASSVQEGVPKVVAAEEPKEISEPEEVEAEREVTPASPPVEKAAPKFTGDEAVVDALGPKADTPEPLFSKFFTTTTPSK
mmetsp:Transcript_19332/g.25533  ORF Transcript_19332/g.25533 Transcript_19332/m.25533 type:complete len:501 (-) Transcript_19332:527-2029(-)